MAKQDTASKPTDLISKKHKQTGLVQELPRETWALMSKANLAEYEEIVAKPTE